MDDAAQADHRAGQPARITQRIEMTALRMVPCAIVAGRAGQPLGLVLVEQFGDLAGRGIGLLLLLEHLHLRGCMGDHEIAVLHALAVDPVALDQIEDEIGGIGLTRHQPLAIDRAEHPAHGRNRVEVKGRGTVARVAPRTAEPHAARLDDGDAHPFLGQMQGRGQAGVAGADDANVGRRLAVERHGRRRIDRRCVPERGLDGRSYHPGDLPWAKGRAE